MRRVLTSSERQDLARTVYLEYLSGCVHREHVARALLKRLAAVEVASDIIVAFSIPGAVFGDATWMKVVAVTLGSLKAAAALSTQSRRIADARSRLGELKSACDGLLMRLELDDSVTRREAAETLKSLRRRRNELDAFEDVAFLFLTPRLRRLAEASAALELRSFGYASSEPRSDPADPTSTRSSAR